MRVVLCVRDAKRNYRVTAYGNLDIPDDGSIEGHMGKELPFTIDQEFGDVQPFTRYLPDGIISGTEKEEFYHFQVVSGVGSSGRLRILALAEERECLPADAP